MQTKPLSPLSPEVTETNLQGLLALYNSKYQTSSDETVIKLLTELNNRAALDQIPLTVQSEAVINLLLTQVNAKKSANEIYVNITKQLIKETSINQAKTAAAGTTFDSKSLHERQDNLSCWLQDHDLTRFMPRSSGDIEVLTSQYSNNLVQDGINQALNNSKIKHIIIPVVANNHYRALYITKPDVLGGEYKLEIFDSKGTISAKKIESQVLAKLKECDIENITTQCTQPKILQEKEDGYSCGDYICANSHKKVKEFGALQADYNQQLISKLETEGNTRNALRKSLIALSQANSHENKKDIINATTERVIESPTSQIDNNTDNVPGFTESENRILNVTAAIQKERNDCTKSYRKNLIALIRQYKIGFLATGGLAEELKKDEALAIKLQIEEFETAGLTHSP
ncbi:MAG: hypothetical protein A3F46_07555 [Legionellales bacterium RIFCSPHIGHO2_12_FULL_42_9]|nr:MAG: hypothetical protein A3F46_07555 [Legionellales bacterium RIFCSPHIGHO2_12_FULL_42_9]